MNPSSIMVILLVGKLRFEGKVIQGLKGFPGTLNTVEVHAVPQNPRVASSSMQHGNRSHPTLWREALHRLSLVRETFSFAYSSPLSSCLSIAEAAGYGA